MLLFLLIPVAAVLPILAMSTVARRKRDLAALAERGQVTAGKVAAHSRISSRRGRQHKRVHLMYERAETGPRRRWVTVTQREWDRLPEGALVDLVYLPEKPSVFATRTHVNAMRVARGLPEL